MGFLCQLGGMPSLDLQLLQLIVKKAYNGTYRVTR